MDAKKIAELLGLQPHPEGGWFAESWRSDESLRADALPSRYAGARRVGTAIYYLITPESFSSMHRVKSDEVFHFYLGDPVEMLLLLPDGSSLRVALGTDLTKGERPQAVVPRGAWQGSRLAKSGRFALLGATVAPGFDYADFELGGRVELTRGWPGEAEMIARLTREV